MESIDPKPIDQDRARRRINAPSYFRRCGRKIQKLTSAAQKEPVSCERM